MSCITGDAPGNVGVLHRRAGPAARQEDGQPGRSDRLPPLLRRRTGSPGADLTFFEYPGARPGRAGGGWSTPSSSVSGRRWRWASGGAAQGAVAGRDASRGASASRIRRASASSSRVGCPRRAAGRPAPRDPGGAALQGFDAVRAFASGPGAAGGFEDTWASGHRGRRWEARGAHRRGFVAYDAPPAAGAGVPGAGTVHHVAWASTMDDHAAWHAA